jgi:putative transposase
VLLRLAYLTVANVFAVLRLLSVSDRDKDTGILVLRHQVAVLERQLLASAVGWLSSLRSGVNGQVRRLVGAVALHGS